MKKVFVIAMLLMILSVLPGCAANLPDNEAKSEIVPEEYGYVILLARQEFHNTFSEYDGIEITETSTMIRTNDSNRLVVQFSYTSNNGNGIYGYEILRDEYNNYEIVQQGEDVTIDNLVRGSD